MDMNALSGNLINEAFRAIALVFALILGSCSDQPSTGVLPSPMQSSGLPVVFIAGTDKFVPSAPVAFENGFDGAGLPMVMMKFMPEDGAEFGSFTARYIGEAVEMKVCNKVVAAPIIQEAITGGAVVVSGYDAWGMMAEFMANGCP